MWTAQLLLLLPFASATFAVVLPKVPTAVRSAGAQYERDILALLGGYDDSDQPMSYNSLEESKYSPATSAILPGSKGFGVALTNPSAELSISQSASERSQTSTATLKTSSAEARTNPPTTVATAVGSRPTILPISSASQVSNHTSKTWQIVGIAIIAVLFVAVSITCAMLFDRLWGFMKDAIRCTTCSVGSEELVPDWEKQSWETGTLSPSPSNFETLQGNGERTGEESYANNIRARELPWNTASQQRNTLHRQQSRSSDHATIASSFIVDRQAEANTHNNIPTPPRAHIADSYTFPGRSAGKLFSK
ncbi:hypothetical protein BS17DRAFT_778731 [Gyrodon lividus]|nr:hypothetical protein BS17DRAFT_778731 [Gyrodon lividus]